MVFENGVKNIQAAAYNGARTVYTFVGIQLPALMRRVGMRALLYNICLCFGQSGSQGLL
jgi:hypothetical protein